MGLLGGKKKDKEEKKQQGSDEIQFEDDNDGIPEDDSIVFEKDEDSESVDEVEEEYQEESEEYAEPEIEREESREEYEQLEKKFISLKKENNEFRKKYEKLNEKFVYLKQENEEFRDKLDERVSVLEAQKSVYEGKFTNLIGDIKNLNSDVNNLRKFFNNLSADFSSYKQDQEKTNEWLGWEAVYLKKKVKQVNDCISAVQQKVDEEYSDLIKKYGAFRAQVRTLMELREKRIPKIIEREMSSLRRKLADSISGSGGNNYWDDFENYIHMYNASLVNSSNKPNKSKYDSFSDFFSQIQVPDEVRTVLQSFITKTRGCLENKLALGLSVQRGKKKEVKEVVELTDEKLVKLYEKGSVLENRRMFFSDDEGIIYFGKGIELDDFKILESEQGFSSYPNTRRLLEYQAPLGEPVLTANFPKVLRERRGLSKKPAWIVGDILEHAERLMKRKKAFESYLEKEDLSMSQEAYVKFLDSSEGLGTESGCGGESSSLYFLIKEYKDSEDVDFVHNVISGVADFLGELQEKQDIKDKTDFVLEYAEKKNSYLPFAFLHDLVSEIDISEASLKLKEDFKGSRILGRNTYEPFELGYDYDLRVKIDERGLDYLKTHRVKF